MKKALIAGVASLALTVVPVASVFAATTFTDTINVTVSASCEVKGGGSGTNGGSTYSASMTMNQLKTDVGTTTVSAKCNGAKGYTVKLTTTALTNGTVSSYTIPYYTSTAPVAGTAVWAAAKGASTSTTWIANNGTVMETSAADTSTSYTTQDVSYKVSTSTIQPTGTYTGTATYTLTQKT